MKQLARFLMMFANGGTLGGQRLLKSATVDEIIAPQPNSLEGLGWESFTYEGKYTMYGHSGVDSGVSTDMYFDPATGAGFIVLTNSDVYLTHWTQFEAGGPSLATCATNHNGTPLYAMLDIDAALIDRAEAAN